MARLMSVALMTDQVRRAEKTVTMRLGADLFRQHRDLHGLPAAPPGRRRTHHRLGGVGRHSFTACHLTRAEQLTALVVWAVIVLLGSVIAASTTGGWPTSADMRWVLLAAGGTATAIVGGTTYSHRRMLRYGLTQADIDTLRAALVRHHHRRDTVTPEDREVALASVAATQLHAITASVAWDSGYLDLGRAVLDPDAELTEIRSFAGELRTMRTRLGTAPTGDSAAAAQARTHHGERLTELDTVFNSLAERVAALHHYATVLAALSETITALDSIEQSRAAGDDIATLAAQLGANDLATDRYDRLTADAAALRAEITHFTHTLTGIAP